MSDSPNTQSSTPARGARWWLPRITFVTVVVLQLYFIHRGYSDPHKHFAFQPFNESDQWSAKIVRVTKSGKRINVRKKWFGYRWGRLVQARGLSQPWFWKRANSGSRSILVFLQEALDWVADNTPRDTETLYYEAKVKYKANRRGPYIARLKSHTRVLDGAPSGAHARAQGDQSL